MKSFEKAVDVVAPELSKEFPFADHCAKAACHGVLHRLADEGRLEVRHARYLVTVLNKCSDRFEVEYVAAGGPANEPVAFSSFDAHSECWPECWGNTGTVVRITCDAEQIGIKVRGDAELEGTIMCPSSDEPANSGMEDWREDR